jgi:hypothetical protein
MREIVNALLALPEPASPTPPPVKHVMRWQGAEW